MILISMIANRPAVFGLSCRILGACDHPVDFRGRDQVGCRDEYSRSELVSQWPRVDVGVSWDVPALVPSVARGL